MPNQKISTNQQSVKTAFIIHGSYADPDTGWYKTLGNKLEKDGYLVFIPKFPTGHRQSLSTWKEVFSQYKARVTADTIFITHRVGAPFLFSILGDLEKTHAKVDHVNGIICVDPLVGPVKHEGLNRVNASFIHEKFDWKTIHEKMGFVSVITLPEDAYVDDIYSRNVADFLGCPVTGISEKNKEAPETERFIEISDVITNELGLWKKGKQSPSDVAADLLNHELKEAGIGVEIHDFHDNSKEQAQKAQDDSFLLDEGIPAVNTYYEDIMGHIDQAGARSMAQVLREERLKETEAKKENMRQKTNGFFALATIITIGVTGYFFSEYRKPAPIIIERETTIVHPTPFRVENQATVDLSQENIFEKRTLLAKTVREATLPSRSIFHILFQKNVGGIDLILNAKQFFNEFEVTVPDELYESMTGGLTYGGYGGDETYPFVLLEIDSFDRAFNGMEAWEEDLILSTKDIFMLPENITNNPSVYEKGWDDRISNNRRFRILRAPVWELYEFINENETILERPRPYHIMPEATRGSIAEINTENIRFSRSDDFLKSLSVGDVIVYSPKDITETSISRVIENFEIIDSELIVNTRNATTLDLIPRAPDGIKTESRFNSETRTLEYFYIDYSEDEELLEGAEETVLLYTFLRDDLILITTHEAVVDEVLERLSEENREN